MALHTATGEWQSFEMRMRRRRAERLALRAAVAAQAGCLEDARACLPSSRTHQARFRVAKARLPGRQAEDGPPGPA